MLPQIRDQLVQNLEAQRNQFDDIFALGMPFRSQSEKLTRAYMYCRRLGLNWHEAARMFYVAKGEHINRVLHYSRVRVRALKPRELYWIYPYFKNRHTFGLLEIRDIKGKSVRTVKLNPSRFLFFGLHAQLPGIRQIRLFDSREVTSVTLNSPMGLSQTATGQRTAATRSPLGGQEALAMAETPTRIWTFSRCW